MPAVEPQHPSAIPARPCDPSEPAVLVVGGGPAGCAAALSLLDRGVPVRILDRAYFPRDKVCGDVLVPAAVFILEELGLDVEEAGGIACAGLSYIGPSGCGFTGEFRDRNGRARPWHNIRRAVFDAWLLRKARQAGAEVFEGTEVQRILFDACGAVRGVEARDGRRGRIEIGCAAVIGADGASSAVARSVGSSGRDPEHMAVAVRGYAKGVRLARPYAEVYTSRAVLPGCAWIVPVEGEACNIGAGIVLRDARRKNVRLARLLDGARQAPGLDHRLEGALVEGLRGWSLPLASRRKRIAGHGWLLAGDAAALVDPLTGHGVNTALASGRLAGKILADALKEKNLSVSRMSAYERAAKRLFLRPARAGRLLQRMHAHPVFAELLALSGAHSRILRSLLLRVAGHIGVNNGLGGEAAP